MSCTNIRQPSVDAGMMIATLPSFMESVRAFLSDYTVQPLVIDHGHQDYRHFLKTHGPVYHVRMSLASME